MNTIRGFLWWVRWYMVIIPTYWAWDLQARGDFRILLHSLPRWDMMLCLNIKLSNLVKHHGRYCCCHLQLPVLSYLLELSTCARHSPYTLWFSVPKTRGNHAPSQIVLFPSLTDFTDSSPRNPQTSLSPSTSTHAPMVKQPLLVKCSWWSRSRWCCGLYTWGFSFPG